jgi:hypothetical protein
MRRWPALLMIVALACTGCRFSKVASDASVIVSGRAVDAGGAPLANATVRLYKQADLGEALFGTVITLGTLGVDCLLPAAPTVCHRARTVTTDQHGRYSFRLTGADTQGTLGTESTLAVVVADPAAGAAGPSTTITFTVRAATVALPPARLWDARPHVAERRGVIRLSWRALPAGTGTGAVFSAQLFGAEPQLATWTQPGTAGHAAIDARLLEDRSGTVAAAARTSFGGAADAHGSYLSARVPARATAGAPPSRGHPCFAVTGTDTPASTRQASCAATDGDLGSPAHLTVPRSAVVTGAVLDLGRVRSVRFVVVRGVAGTFVVEASRNGHGFHTVATGTGSGAASTAALHVRAAARYVRVRSPSGLDESLLDEISVW